MSTVLRAQIECPSCHQLIASLHRHDFQSCRCGAVSIDGGRDYLRVLFKDERPIFRSIVIDADVTQEDASRMIEVLNSVRACEACSEDDPHSPYPDPKHRPWAPVSTIKWMTATGERHRLWNVKGRSHTSFEGCWPAYSVSDYCQRLADEGLLEIRYSKKGKRTGWRLTKPLVSFSWFQGKFERRAS